MFKAPMFFRTISFAAAAAAYAEKVQGMCDCICIYAGSGMRHRVVIRIVDVEIERRARIYLRHTARLTVCVYSGGGGRNGKSFLRYMSLVKNIHKYWRIFREHVFARVLDYVYVCNMEKEYRARADSFCHVINVRVARR